MSRRAIKVLALASFLVLTNGGIALGKGPESVTITGPGVGSPIELINPDFFHGDYTDQVKVLMRQTSLWYATGGGSRLSAKPEGRAGTCLHADLDQLRTARRSRRRTDHHPASLSSSGEGTCSSHSPAGRSYGLGARCRRMVPCSR